jgi:hypothetical protein
MRINSKWLDIYGEVANFLDSPLLSTTKTNLTQLKVHSLPSSANITSFSKLQQQYLREFQLHTIYLLFLPYYISFSSTLHYIQKHPNYRILVVLCSQDT